SRLEVAGDPPGTGEAGSAPAGEAAGAASRGAGFGSVPDDGFAIQEGRAGGGTAGTLSGTGGDGAFAEILRRIGAAKRYPEEARRLGHRGTVAVRFRIGLDGAVTTAEVAASSGSSLLDAASLETVRRAAPLPAVPGWLRVRFSYGLAEARP
ncbi:MAG: energy transducer TonB, partial [candidate division NC10 bacterium]